MKLGHQRFIQVSYSVEGNMFLYVVGIVNLKKKVRLYKYPASLLHYPYAETNLWRSHS